MAGPSIQISYNDSEIRIFWDYDPTGTYVSYELVWDTDIEMGTEKSVASNLSNTPDGYYSRQSIFYKFKRETIGVSNDDSFYLMLRGVDSIGGKDDGAVKYIPSLPEQLPQNKIVEIYGYDYANKIWRKVGVGVTGALA